MKIDDDWYLDLPKRRVIRYDKIYLLAFLNSKRVDIDILMTFILD